MNLILLEPNELPPDGEIQLGDRRAEHLRKVLRVKPGDRVRVGVVDGLQGTAEVLALESRTVTLRCRCDEPPPPAGSDTLLLAFARPKVLLRCLEHATALGFGRIVLFRSRRVERSHLSSHAVTPSVIDDHLRRGLEQARRTLRPSVLFVSRFRELIEVELPRSVPSENRFVADAGAEQEAALARPSAAPLSLVIGPEGGLIPHELEQFALHGFRLVRAGTQPLRVETALSYLAGQLRAAQARTLTPSG
ncbi:MAG TPA: RsmE family RNA methyltransferase [Polyangiaceae bacterium]|nr:RsmE family RNA methyltransferase [Polyangiaceae bacterium]